MYEYATFRKHPVTICSELSHTIVFGASFSGSCARPDKSALRLRMSTSSAYRKLMLGSQFSRVSRFMSSQLTRHVGRMVTHPPTSHIISIYDVDNSTKEYAVT